MSPLPDPASAPPRTDLPFLTRRSARRRAADGPPEAATSAGSPGDGSAVADFIAGRAGHPRQHAATGSPRPPGPGSPPPSSPAPSSPAAPPRPAGTPSGGPDLLDLTGPAPPAPSAPAASPTSGLLDLSTPGAPATPARQPEPTPARRRARPRVAAGEQRLLEIKSPSVWLTRVQSGIGELTFEAVCGPEVGDLRLGAAYQFASGATSTVQLAGGNRFAPSSRRPVIVAGHDDYERLRIDLRQNREIERITIYAFSESRATLAWGGTLVAETFGRARIELPLETLHSGSIAVLSSVYNVDGELVVRAEMETIRGDVREAARAYGYDRITWRDDRTPVD